MKFVSHLCCIEICWQVIVMRGLTYFMFWKKGTCEVPLFFHKYQIRHIQSWSYNDETSIRWIVRKCAILWRSFHSIDPQIYSNYRRIPRIFKKDRDCNYFYFLKYNGRSRGLTRRNWWRIFFVINNKYIYCLTSKTPTGLDCGI